MLRTASGKHATSVLFLLNIRCWFDTLTTGRGTPDVSRKSAVNKMKKFTQISIIISLIFYSFSAFAGENHGGEIKNLVYFIEYLSPKGVTTADSSGITFKPYEFDWSFMPKVLPEKYFGDYDLYFAGETMNFRVHLKNTGKRTFRNLKVFAYQELLNSEDGAGDPIGSENSQNWFIPVLRGGEEVVLDGSFDIPVLGEGGLDQTHLKIVHWLGGDPSTASVEGNVIIDDPQAGIWCPI